MLTKLELARRRKRMTLKQVANAAGCSESFVSYVERGYKRPSEKLARKLAAVVGIDAAKWETLQKRA